jgi:hypothetical protein
MRATYLQVAAICLAIAYVACAAPIATVNDYTPKVGKATGAEVFRIFGCGFRTYSEVTCVWNNRWVSRVNVIVSDSLIICETPIIPKDQFSTLPQVVPFKIYFDGDQEALSVFLDPFYFGPTLEQFTPSFGHVQGGETLFVAGNGFSDFSTAVVTIDNRPCTSPKIVDDFTIQCKVPAGEFNANSFVDVYFENNPRYHLHFEETYHYGPQFTEVDPPCGNIFGGTQVTLIGEGLDDPVLFENVAPVNATPVVEVVYTTTDGVKRINAVNVTRNPENYSILFFTPELDVTDPFGAVVRFDVFFKGTGIESKVSVAAPFVYGPIIYSDSINPVITGSHAGGQDILFLSGCGFGFYDNENSTITVLGDGVNLCEGPLVLTNNDNFGEDTLICTTAAATECVSEVDVTVQFVSDFIPSEVLDTPGSRTLAAGPVEFGPVIDTATFFPTRGARIGGTTVTVHGTDFFYTADTAVWGVTVNFESTFDGVVIKSVPATIVSDTELSFVTPVGLFDLDVSVSFDFVLSDEGAIQCNTRYTDGLPTFHFGPVCSDLTPLNGHLSGGDSITLNGQGFEEDGNLPEDTEIRFCLHRLIDEPAFYDSTCIYEPNTIVGLSQNNIITVTPDYRQDVSTIAGANRLFGDDSDVWIHFYAPGQGKNVEFPRNQLRPGLEVARILCPISYNFGPGVESISPQKGPLGPRASGSPGTSVTISGTGFADPELGTDIHVFFGEIDAQTHSIVDDNTIVATTPWANPLDANTNVDITVIFDTCNETFSGYVHRWGPVIQELSGPFGTVSASSANPNADLWGLYHGGDESIEVIGNFDEFEASEISCLINGSPVLFTINEDGNIVCITEAVDFGVTATLELVFGTVVEDGTTSPDWRQTLLATQRLHFTPRIDSFSPSFGHTSGGETVTITGEGFNPNFNTFECFFGHYSSGQAATVNIEGTQVVCSTPTNRAEFNSDVFVHIQVDDAIGTKGDNHVLSGKKFHYGPVCTDIQPSSSPLGGLSNVVLVGSGFTDCSASNSTPFRDCIFNQYRVAFKNPSNGQRTFLDAATNRTGSGGNNDVQVKFNAPAADCGYEPIVEIAFYSPLVSSFETQGQFIIECKNPNRDVFFHYGPIFSSQSSDFFEAGVSYGWNGDAVTIAGANFKDPLIFSTNDNIQCYVGDKLGRVDFVAGSGTTLRCLVPDNTWDSLLPIRLEWTGAAKSCKGSHAINGQEFHYGPVIRSVTPERGYVAGLNPITISGFAFGCCGINNWQCLFPAGSIASQTTRDQDSVVCDVPVNNKIDQVISNLGVGFKSTRFSNQQTSTFTEQGTALKYYYGPAVTGITPTRVSLSGRDEFITITGEGFNDPYLLEAFCDFISETGAKNITPSIPLEKSAKTDTTLICPVPNFARPCGSIDSVRPRWRRNSPAEYRPQLLKQYFKTEPPVYDDKNVLPFFVDGGSTVPAYADSLNYGPEIVSVCDASGNCGSDIPTGTSSYIVSFDNLRDFVSSSDTNDFGLEEALCIFGNRRASALSPIVADSENNEIGTVVCEAPTGSFNWKGEISVILNPNLDEDTVLTGSDNWHWLPYIDRISRNYLHTVGHETLLVRGAGFSKYDTVVCNIDGKGSFQADITSDYFVSCRTPVDTPKSNVHVELRFCESGLVDENGICDCDIRGSRDTADYTSQLTYLGVTNVSPREGSVCGGTSVTISGWGFSNFDKFECNWGASITAAVLVSDSKITCESADYTQRFTSQFAQCVTASLTGYRSGRKEIIQWPFNFEYGLPQVTTVLPSSVDYDDLPATIEIFGDYLSGGSVDSRVGFECKFGDLPAVEATLITTVASGASNRKLVCKTPPKESFTIGTYNVEIRFPCLTNFTNNRIALEVTQVPTVGDVTPTTVIRLGGEKVHIGGTSLAGGFSYMCSFGNVSLGENVLVSAKYDAENNTITCKTPFFIDIKDVAEVETAISLDGGLTLYRTRELVTYQRVDPSLYRGFCEDKANDASAFSLAPSFILVAFLAFLSFLL